LLGTGYESFWLGPRLLSFWQSGVGMINEAHNGYLEVYLNLGSIGILLLAGFLIASYRTICKRFKFTSFVTSLSLAFWTVMLFHSVTEADFRSGLMWFTFLLGGLAVPRRTAERAKSIAADEAAVTEVHGISHKYPPNGDTHEYDRPASEI